MACFLVSATVGIGTAVARHIVKRHENKLELEGKAHFLKNLVLMLNGAKNWAILN